MEDIRVRPLKRVDLVTPGLGQAYRGVTPEEQGLARLSGELSGLKEAITRLQNEIEELKKK
ncbi:hypothetical protein [Thermosediminibacter litoriperuensis]|uniref:Uncharacterized protein n=1 Tax=Thermosediminibacter litoriperuensis TaxID=291989 RepID=A0A5S5ALB2_9FIRM|nr:hypothetical protein [Thermosediminibacter litoriperuensis]TYP51665.1 hypothetical protein LZ11_01788 [Thermosediminibacter litoriperuensis]